MLRARGKNPHGMGFQLDTWKHPHSLGWPYRKPGIGSSETPCIGRYTHRGRTKQWGLRGPAVHRPFQTLQGRFARVFQCTQIHTFFFSEKTKQESMALSHSQRTPYNPNKIHTPACQWHIDMWVPQTPQETAALSSLVQCRTQSFSLKIRMAW